MNSNVKNVKKVLLSDNWYTLNKVVFDYKMSNGDWVEQEREAYDRGNGATVLLYNKMKQTVVLISQFRMPTYLNGNESGMLIEACAGLLDGDDPETCVLKEAEEESGFRVSRVKKVFEAYMSPGAVTEVIHFYIAEYHEKDKVGSGGGLAEEQEDITVLEVKFDKAMSMISKGEIKDAKTIMLLQHLKLHGIMNS
ncbi:GDP-mannose pyrophosphatase NudK [Lutimonas sp.]|uniref:GDP-mannose pyrophosphatase NudK n=1 Tax=Lutimonas sp. TaxID=1872403 RepID=UPI003D9AB595